MSAITRCSYKLEFRTYSGESYSWTDYSSHLIRFGDITMQAEGILLNSFRASMGNVIVDNGASFWTLQTDTLLFNNTGEAYGKRLRRRGIRISAVVPDSAGTTTTTALFTGLVDDLIVNMDGTATIKVISRDRMAQEQRLDAEKINNNTLAGAWGTAKLYTSRTQNLNDNSYSYIWYYDRKIEDLLTRVSEALDDSASSIESISIPVDGTRRIVSSLASYKNITGSDTETPHTMFYHLSAGVLLASTRAGNTVTLYSVDPENGTRTSRLVVTVNYDPHIYAAWNNTVSNKLYFIVRYSSIDNAKPDRFRLYSMAADYTTAYVQLDTTVANFFGTVCYSQDRNGGNGSIFLFTSNASASAIIYEYMCNDVGTFTQLNLTNNFYGGGIFLGYESFMTASYSHTTQILSFVMSKDASTDDLFDFHTDHESAWDDVKSAAGLRSPSTTNTAILAIYHDTDRTFCITYAGNTVGHSPMKVRVRLDSDADGAAWSTALYDTGTDDYRWLTQLVRGDDGLYFCEYSPTADSAIPIYPSQIMCIKDTDKTAVVNENLMTTGALFGERLVERQYGMPKDFIDPFWMTSEKWQMYTAAFCYCGTAPWKLYGMTNGDRVMWYYASIISSYLQIAYLRDLSAWDFRCKVAERSNAIVYYKPDGTFCFKKRVTGGAVTHTLSAPKITATANGERNVKNAGKCLPYREQLSQPEIIEVAPHTIRNPDSTLVLSKVKFGINVTAGVRWRVKMTSATAFTLDEYTAFNVWTNHTTGTKGTTLLHDEITIEGSAWTGTAITGDVAEWYTYKTEFGYIRCNEFERVEAVDMTSIENYQRTEFEVNNVFVGKMIGVAIIENLLDYWKNPHRVVQCEYPVDLDIEMLDVVNFADSYLNITTATTWAVTKRTIRMGQPTMSLELTEII